MARDTDEPVRLTRIYTRGGDRGETSLGDGSRVTKLDCRIAAFGAVDEVNSQIGLVLAGGLPQELSDVLERVQNELFDVGADLSKPLRPSDPEQPELRITQPSVDRLETWCDEFSAPLGSLRSFILPGGLAGAAQLHVARTVARRAERAAWAAAEAYGTEPVADPERPGGVNRLAITYLNRLSDLLFILTRVVNGPEGDVLWIPGGERE
jgi:cob(I)alamin adenosyltransferase